MAIKKRLFEKKTSKRRKERMKRKGDGHPIHLQTHMPHACIKIIQVCRCYERRGWGSYLLTKVSNEGIILPEKDNGMFGQEKAETRI